MQAVEILADVATGLAQRGRGLFAVAADDGGALGGLDFLQFDQPGGAVLGGDGQRIERAAERLQLQPRGLGLTGEFGLLGVAPGGEAADGQRHAGLAQRLGAGGLQIGDLLDARGGEVGFFEAVFLRRLAGVVKGLVDRVELRGELRHGLGAEGLNGSLGGEEAVDGLLELGGVGEGLAAEVAGQALVVVGAEGQAAERLAEAGRLAQAKRAHAVAVATHGAGALHREAARGEEVVDGDNGRVGLGKLRRAFLVEEAVGDLELRADARAEALAVAAQRVGEAAA